MLNNQTDDYSSIRYFSIYINLFYLIFGNIGNLFKIFFFLQKPLRSLPCTIYILYSTFSDFITLNNFPSLQLLIHLYPKYHWIKVTADWSNNQNETGLLPYTTLAYDILACKIRTYLHMLSTDLSMQMLLFASINRFYFNYHRKKKQNNTHVFVKHFCDHPNVYKLCIISSVITALVNLQHIFNFTIRSPVEGCVPHNRVLWTVWISFIHCFLLPVLMITFGVLSLRNIRCSKGIGSYFNCLQCRRRHQPTMRRFIGMCSQCSRGQNSTQYRIDIQLTSMIITEISVTVLTSLPYGIYAVYHLLWAIERKTLFDPNESAWIPLLIRMTMYFEPSCGVYIYLMTLTTMRKRFYKMVTKNIISIYCCRRNKPRRGQS